MKKFNLSVIIIATMAVSLAACQPTNQTIRIDAQDAGETINMKIGDTLIVKLYGNVTTGYNWIPAPQEPVLLMQEGNSKVTPDSDLIGAPGDIVLEFTAVAQGQTVLRLDHKRSWETDVPPMESYQVTVVVE